MSAEVRLVHRLDRRTGEPRRAIVTPHRLARCWRSVRGTMATPDNWMHRRSLRSSSARSANARFVGGPCARRAAACRWRIVPRSER